MDPIKRLLKLMDWQDANRTLKVEEKALYNHFGEAYETYCQKVRYRIFPYIW